VRLFYRAFDNNGTERIRIKTKPSAVLLNDKAIHETSDGGGYSWTAMADGGLLTVRRKDGDKVVVME